MTTYVRLPTSFVDGPDPDGIDDEEPVDHVYQYWTYLNLPLEDQMRMLIEEYRRRTAQ